MATKISLAIMLILAAALPHTTVAQTTHIVGDSLGWIVPPGGPIAYATWAAIQTFTVGDILVFNFTSGEQDVARVSKEHFDTCNSTNPRWLETTGPANITLTSAGEYYFIGTMERHCFFGQKLAINVIGTSGPTASPAPPPPPTAPVPASPRAPVTWVVGNDLGWIVPPGGSVAYAAWAYDKTFIVGDTLVFNFENGTQDVAVVSKAAYATCDTNNTITVLTTSPARFTLTSVGEYYFTSTYARHCALGQQLAINVIASSTATPPSSSPPPPPPATPVPAPPRSTITYVVGDDLGWIVPPGGSVAYTVWAYNKTFIVGDTLVFNFVNGTQDVAKVTKAAYETCDTNNTITVLTTSPVRITLTTAGEHYFTSTYARHCAFGQQLAINVIASSTPTPPSSSATPPSSTTTPSSSVMSPNAAEGPASPTAPAPVSSAMSIAVRSFSVTFLSIVIAFLLN